MIINDKYIKWINCNNRYHFSKLKNHQKKQANLDIVINEEVYKNFFGFGLTLTNNLGISQR